MSSEHDFSDIAPYGDEEISDKVAHLVKEPGFENAVKYVMPEVDYPEFAAKLSGIKDRESLQSAIIVPFLEQLEARTTTGITINGLENVEHGKSYTFMSNHRDIVLDASFLNFCFKKNGYPTSEIAIGNNLLIFDWITDLVKLNKSFIVKRNLKFTKALMAARHLSAYIHYAINTKHESVWIAQREGRAKDSNDMTQESLIKMLGLEGGGDLHSNLEAVNIVPLSISYEFDPNDYLKVTEFLMRRRDPDFKKSKHDDLLSMETGILQPKGHVHFEIGRCINEELDKMPAGMDKSDLLKNVCRIIDRSIHSHYRIYPINYIAYDLVYDTDRFKSHYTPADEEHAKDYASTQLAKVQIPDITSEEHDFMRRMFYSMYANPLVNKLSAVENR